MNPQKITICGGGNGAQALTPIAANNIGCQVDIYAPFGDEAERLRTNSATHGGLETIGAVQSKSMPHRISANPAEVIPGSDMVFLVMPAFAHESTLHQIAPHLDANAWVGALPARGGFDYAAMSALAEHGREDVRLFGLQTLPWACRIDRYGQVVNVLGVKQVVDAATRPRAQIEEISAVLKAMLGLSIGAVPNFLALTLANTGQLIHPGIMYGLFANWDGEPFAKEETPLFYHNLSAAGAETLAGLDDDIQAIRSQLASPYLDLTSVHHLKIWLERSYAHSILDPATLQSSFLTNQAYAGIKAPVREISPGQFIPDFHARYLAEDVPFGLAVSRAIAQLAGVETPTMDKVIAWASEKLNKDYLGRDMNEARIPQKYGLENLEQLLAAYA
ncbi:MAG TPA: hypothetical protein G4N94_14485 [Caldilineae bacterium]|nr:hypothetical protein [Caldilineae bacterium]